MYTVIINGVPIQCETATAAIELTRQAAAEGIDSGKADRQSGTDGAGPARWTEQRVRDFLWRIKAQQRKLVDALLETTDARTDNQLCQLLSLKDGRALAGVFTGLFKNAKKVGANPRELYQKHRVTIGDRRQFEYTLAPSFRTAVGKWKP